MKYFPELDVGTIEWDFSTCSNIEKIGNLEGFEFFPDLDFGTIEWDFSTCSNIEKNFKFGQILDFGLCHYRTQPKF